MVVSGPVCNLGDFVAKHVIRVSLVRAILNQSGCVLPHYLRERPVFSLSVSELLF